MKLLAFKMDWIVVPCLTLIAFNLIPSTYSFKPIIPLRHHGLMTKHQNIVVNPTKRQYRSSSSSLLMPLKAKHSSDNDDDSNNDSDRDRFDYMDELQRRIEQLSQPLCYKISLQPDKPKPINVNVILFKPDNEEECGVHAIEYPVGSGNNVILAFETKSECDRFASILKEQQFFEPVSREIKLNDLENYCDSAEPHGTVRVQIVPKGIHVVPPKNNVDELDHNPNLKDQQQMLDDIYQIGSGSSSSSSTNSNTNNKSVVDDGGEDDTAEEVEGDIVVSDDSSDNHHDSNVGSWE